MSRKEDEYLIERMGKLLAEIAIIVNGLPPDNISWSYHDLPEKVRALKQAPPDALEAFRQIAALDWGNAATNGAAYKAHKIASAMLKQAPPAAAVSAANVTPMRQPRADLARLVESINAAVYANGDGLSVTEAIGALELAKLELLKEQEQ